MTRDDFLAAVRELADQLGAELWLIVERRIDAAKAAALEVAMGQLRSGIACDEPEPGVVPAVRRRAPRRCSSCRRLGHDARKCAGVPAVPPAADEVATNQPANQDVEAVEPEAVPETDDDGPDDDSRVAPPPPRSDRFARIEAAAAARKADRRRASGGA